MKSLAENHQGELQQGQTAQIEQDKQHQAEITQFKGQLDEQEKKFQDLEVVIRRGKQQWQGTFDAVDDLIILTDEAGVILRCNRATGEAFQLGYTQIIDRGIDDLFANVSESIRGMIPGEIKQIKDPRAEIWYEISKNHLLIDGRQEGWVYIFRNVTVQKQALREQQRLAHYYELLVNNNPVAIVTFNLEGRIIDCNPAFESLFLYSKREALGWKDDLLISPTDLISETHLMAETLREGETVHRITQRKRKDGSLLDVEVFWIPVILSGKQVGSLGLYHDVSELVRSQESDTEELEQAATETAQVLYDKVQEEGFHLVAPLRSKQRRIRSWRLSLLRSSFRAGVEEQVGELQQSGSCGYCRNCQETIDPGREIEGIGPVYAQKLLEIGVKTTEDLLERGRDRKGRDFLVEKSGISASHVLRWVNMADLMRIHGIGEEYSELLEKAGVDTVGCAPAMPIICLMPGPGKRSHNWSGEFPIYPR
jgi:PAS domain S-box-containing protein